MLIGKMQPVDRARRGESTSLGLNVAVHSWEPQVLIGERRREESRQSVKEGLFNIESA